MTQITLIPSTRGPILMFADYAQSQEGFTRLGPLKTNIPQSVLVSSTNISTINPIRGHGF